MRTAIVLSNNQAIGDILMMSCAVRDLYLQFYDRYDIYVTTSCQDVWLNNPYICRNGYIRKPGDLAFRLGYSDAIKQSNQRSNHFSAGFVYDLAVKLATKLSLTDMRPDVHLTDEEKSPKSRVISDPYWVIVAGGKRDFTAKIWDHVYYQQVVDLLKAKITFVQLGTTRHIHKPLNNVINLIDKTSIRKMLVAIYHSDGVICPVTSAMHAAAAFNKPCVVIAGGREPWWWEAYTKETWRATIPDKEPPSDFVEHCYLDTIGQLPCCQAGGCWKSHVEVKYGHSYCRHAVKGASTFQPECLNKITPEQVVKCVEAYINKEAVIAKKIPAHLKPSILTVNIPSTPTTANKVTVTSVNTPEATPITRIANRIIKKPPVISIRKSPIVKPQLIPPTKTIKPLNVSPVSLPGIPINDIPPVTICIIAYGNYFELMKKCLGSIINSRLPNQYQIIVGLNEVCNDTRNYVRDIAQKYSVKIYDSPVNILKYPMLRKMWHTDTKITTDWLIYFDDDSYVTTPDWLEQLYAYITRSPQVVMIGKKYLFNLTGGQKEWIKQATWYRNKPINDYSFITGGWWAIKTKIIYELNWPDPRIQHNGGDVMLGMALHQNDYKMGNYFYGVAINNHKRRGVSQLPVGFKVK